MTHIERIYDVATGETTERELTQAEIAELSSTKSVAEMQAEDSAPKP
jgi:hypothetical protein